MVNPSFKVAVVGPSRVGKTTLLTAILAETEELLSGSPVDVAMDETTGNRVLKQRKALRKAIEIGEFNAAALGGTQSVSDYQVLLRSSGDETVEIPFSIKDFPGRWLDPDQRRQDPLAAEGWPQCEQHMKESVMLLVPIDAAVLMEAVTPNQRAAVLDLLALDEVEAVARKWAKERNLDEHRDEPAVLVLAPLKCEKYFDDNSGFGKDAGRLRERVLQRYGRLLEIVDAETPNRMVRVVYAPIDTYGCVELMESSWHEIDGSLEFSAHYRFRGRPPVISVKAAGAVMQELCRCIVEGWDRIEAQGIDRDRAGQQRVQARIAERKGFWGTVFYHLGGEATENRTKVSLFSASIRSAERRRLQLEEGVKKLAMAADDPRVERW